MDLVKQLEDKKKEYRSLKRQHCDDCTKDEECQTCKPEFDNLRKEIAILKQAIAEIKKQGQEILDKIVNYNQNKLRWLWNDGEIFIALSSIKQQLNQPKEEDSR